MDDRPRPGHRLGCLGWCAVALGIVLAMAVTGWIWFTSRSDIEETRGWLRSRGLPATWGEVGLHPADAAATADWRRLLALAGSLKAYDITNGPWAATPGVDAPAGLAAHLQAQPASDAEDYRAILDRLGDRPIHTRTSAGIHDGFDELAPLRRLMRWSTQALMFAGPSRLLADARRSARLVPVREPVLALTQLASCNLAGMWMAAAAGSMPRLPDGDRSAMAAICRELADRLRVQGELALRNEAVAMLGYAESMSLEDLRQVLPSSSLVESGAIAVVLRAGRADVVRTAIELHDAAVAAPGPPERLAASHAIQGRIASLPAWSPLRASWMTMTALDHVVSAECRVRQQLALLAAELDGLPWPADPEDPAGGSYRRFERDGRLVGAYSVGPNGADDHGRGDDRCIDLYGPCKPARP